MLLLGCAISFPVKKERPIESPLPSVLDIVPPRLLEVQQLPWRRLTAGHGGTYPLQ
jgi:hypothetical protein